MTIAMKYDALGELAVRLKLLSSSALAQAVSLSNDKETSLAQLIASADLAKLDKVHDILHLQLRMAEGELLVQFQLISRAQLEAALLVSEDLRLSLSATLLKQGVLRPTHLVAVFDELQGMDFSDLNQSLIDPVFAELIPRSVSARFGILALARINNRTLVATPHPENIPALDDLQILTGGRVIPVRTTEASVAAFWKSFNFEGVRLDTILEVPEDDVSIADLAADAAEAPVIRLVNELLANAITNLVSDIHIEPKEKDVAVRYRKDGILAEATRFPKTSQSAAIARLKIMSNLDVSEKRLPQDGKIRVKVLDNMVDLRVSTMPSQYGEKIVIRVLNRNASIRPVTELGFNNTQMEQFLELMNKPQGIMFVTGPTGSGKTTTLYSALGHVQSPSKNIITIEDPIEYNFEHATQVQVQAAIDLTFARVLRAVLRQDPDIVLIGETRDHETAKIAVEAALTGHMVLTSLHTNSACASITRLGEMGIESYLVGQAMLGAVAQRLVRTICPDCKESYDPSQEVRDALGLEIGEKLFRGAGCPTCRGTGYKGRRAAYEIFVVSEATRELIIKEAPANVLQLAAQKEGMIPLRNHAIELLKAGLSTFDEFVRVIYSESGQKEAICPRCKNLVEEEFINCPFCNHQLKPVCLSCGMNVKREWSICPKCGDNLRESKDICKSCLAEMDSAWVRCPFCFYEAGNS
ncbi:MAG TPA: type II secretion system protein GspE [Cyanobacteria bacterium UBA8530]|nr:type II secretion system protein GspE [Cyanobacteria bacterium UBA8530]